MNEQANARTNKQRNECLSDVMNEVSAQIQPLWRRMAGSAPILPTLTKVWFLSLLQAAEGGGWGQGPLDPR